MANVFFDIVVPLANGPGPALNITSLGFTKLFSLTGTFVGAVGIEISNDGVNWVPLTTLNAANDAEKKFAAIFVRANVSGYVSGVPDLSVGANNGGSAFFALPVPAGNGAGAPVNVSSLPKDKTLLYNGGMEASISVEISQDGVTFTEAASFTGLTPSGVNIDGAVQLARVVVSGFVGGVGVVSMAASQESGPPVTGPIDTLAFFDASGALTGSVVIATVDPVTGNILLGSAAATQLLFLSTGAAVNGSNAGAQLSSLTANRAAFRANQYGANAGVPGVVGFKSRSAAIGGFASVVAGDVLWRATAIGVAADNVSVPLAGFISLVAASPLGGNFVPCDFILDLAPLAGPINVRKQALRIDSEGIFYVKESANTMAGVAVLGAAGTVVVANTRVTATTKFNLTAQDGGSLLTGSLQQSARVAATSFTIRSTAGAADAGVRVYYQLFEPAAP